MKKELIKECLELLAKNPACAHQNAMKLAEITLQSESVEYLIQYKAFLLKQLGS